MPNEHLLNGERDQGNERAHRLFAPKPKIKILLYTDDPVNITPSEELSKFRALGSMIARLKAHSAAFADLSVKWKSRNSDRTHHADNKIDKVMKDELDATKVPFDEIWFFGVFQANTEKYSPDAFLGGPRSELDENEVIALSNWMTVSESDGSSGGGVLVAGDHSEERPAKAVPGMNSRCPDSSTLARFLGLGRSIGRCVPRGGLLRLWDGGPTNRPQDGNNTVARSGFQTDAIPQLLTLRNVDDWGDPDPNGHPHPLFFYKPACPIDVFPDHDHEGAVVIPGKLDPKIWPTHPISKKQPQPHEVAYGINRRNERINIVATYNGDLANVGRVVADSTWHHYMNINLAGFPHPAPEGSHSDKIGQFYGNLAVWLSPRSKRVQMAHHMLWELAHYTLVLEEKGQILSIGRTAWSIASQVASTCEIHELIQVVTPEKFRKFKVPERARETGGLPSKELILGCILDIYHQEIIRAETSEGSYEPMTVDDAISTGFRKAFDQDATNS